MDDPIRIILVPLNFILQGLSDKNQKEIGHLTCRQHFKIVQILEIVEIGNGLFWNLQRGWTPKIPLPPPFGRLDVLTKWSKTTGALKLNLYGLLYFHTFYIRIFRGENYKWKRQQLGSLFAKNEKLFYQSKCLQTSL